MLFRSTQAVVENSAWINRRSIGNRGAIVWIQGRAAETAAAQFWRTTQRRVRLIRMTFAKDPNSFRIGRHDPHNLFQVICRVSVIIVSGQNVRAAAKKAGVIAIGIEAAPRARRIDSSVLAGQLFNGEPAGIVRIVRNHQFEGRDALASPALQTPLQRGRAIPRY